MQNPEETVNVIIDEINIIIEQYIGRVCNPDACSNIRAEITNYLMQIQLKLGYLQTPEVRVKHEGDSVTVNFFDNNDNPLGTLGDMLEFMGKPNTTL